MVSPTFAFGELFDVRDQHAHFAGDELRHRAGVRLEDTELLHLELLAVAPQANVLLERDGALEHSNQHHHAAVVVVPAVEDEGLEGRVLRAARRGHVLDDRFQNLVDAEAFFGRRRHRHLAVEADDVFDLSAGALDVGRGQIDLVDDGDDLEIVLEAM